MRVRRPIRRRLRVIRKGRRLDPRITGTRQDGRPPEIAPSGIAVGDSFDLIQLCGTPMNDKQLEAYKYAAERTASPIFGLRQLCFNCLPNLDGYVITDDPDIAKRASEMHNVIAVLTFVLDRYIKLKNPSDINRFVPLPSYATADEPVLWRLG